MARNTLAALALRALSGRRTYWAICSCDECNGRTKIPWRNRLNQPPFRWDPDDRAAWRNDRREYMRQIGA